MSKIIFFTVSFFLSISLSSLLWAGKGGNGGGGEPPNNCNAAPGIQGSDVSLNFNYAGVNRAYVLHLPSQYDCSTPLPLVIGLHGYYGSGSGFENETADMFEHINTNNYIGVFPTGIESHLGSGVTSFNDLGSRFDTGPDGQTCTNTAYAYGDFDNCGANEENRTCHWGTSCADDAGFIRALINSIEANYEVDSQRLYMTGFSQGGQTVSGLACALADKLAAVAPVHGFAANGYTCGPNTKLSIMQVSGTRDNTVRGDGQAGSDGMIYDAASEAAAEWAAEQGCATSSSHYATVADGKKNWTCKQHASCASGAEIVSCSWSGGHVWPKNRKDGNFGLNAIWDFFKNKSK